MTRVSVLALAVAVCFAASAAASLVRVEVPKYHCQFSVQPASDLSAADLAQIQTTIRLVLPARNIEKLHAEILDRADPKSPRYTNWMTMKQIDELTLPEQRHYDTVIGWLRTHDITTFEVQRDAIVLNIDLLTASNLFQTTFRRVSHIEGRTPTVLRAGEYFLPAEVHQSIAAVFGLHGLPLPMRETLISAPEIATVNPTVIANTYSVSGVTVNRNGNNTQSVGEFQAQYMNKADLTKFFKNLVPNAQTGDDQVYKFVGVPYQSGYGVEAELDIQYIMGNAPGVKTSFWEWPNNDFCGDLQAYTAHMLTQDTPNVNSISYGWQGDLSGIGCTNPPVLATDSNFAKLAALGVSVIIASGDSGSGYTPAAECNVTAPEAQTLYPSWPASSPWVTAVGATRFINQQPGVNNEMASDQFGSGGGFSTMFNQSTYQQSVVAAYVNQGAKLPKFPAPGTFPVNGRATPDVAALGEGFSVYTEGVPQPVGGTSASTPTFAALVSLLNEARIQKGKRPLGFLNVFLYSAPANCFFDVTQGTNAISRGGTPVPHGYAAAVGWDAATGLGTPHFPQLLAAALAA